MPDVLPFGGVLPLLLDPDEEPGVPVLLPDPLVPVVPRGLVVPLPLVPLVRPEPIPWLPAPVLLPPQLAESIRTDVTRTRCGALFSAVVDDEADVEDERDEAEVEDECVLFVLFVLFVDTGMSMPLTSTCWPSCPAAAEPSSW